MCLHHDLDNDLDKQICQTESSENTDRMYKTSLPAKIILNKTVI